MKIAAGTKKVVLPLEANAQENNRRAQARGQIFKPVFVVWVVAEDGLSALPHECYSIKGKVTSRTTTGNFPFTWAKTALRNTRLWLETEGELDIETTQPKDMK